MRACVIFNPTARGEKASRFREFLATIGPRAELKPTTAPGSARILARDAVAAGHDLIIAAGGDGTAFEVLNGIADAPGGLSRAVLGVLPLGTANVLAHELGVPQQPARAWEALTTGRVLTIDCGLAEFTDEAGALQRAHFVVLAGAGLDARAVQLVDWGMKKRAGKLAYVAAALGAFARYPDVVRCTLNGRPFTGRVLVAGNGRFYAGDVPLFGDGALQSGLLHIRGLEHLTAGVLVRCLFAYMTGRWSLDGKMRADAVEELGLTSERPVPLQLDGELAGWLPATLRVLPGALRVLAPQA